MNNLLSNSLFFGTFISILAYIIGTLLKRKFKLAIFNPLLVAIILVIIFLLIFKIDYQSYEVSAKYLSYLLTPATVALAIPLYEQLYLLRKYFLAISISITSGVLTSLSSIFLLAKLFNLNHTEYITLLPKSITTAIGMQLSSETGGIVTITVAVIVVTGILGNMLGTFVFRIFHIKSSIAQGLALGTSAHAIGTAKALELGEIEGAMSSLALALSGILTVIFINFYLYLI